MSQPESNDASEKTIGHQSWRQRLTSIRLSLPVALALIILVAIVIVAVAYGIYWNSGDRKYDIARPGNQTDSKILEVEEESRDRTSPVSEADARRKVADFAKEVRAVSGMDSFEPNSVSDQAIKLVPSDQPSL